MCYPIELYRSKLIAQIFKLERHPQFAIYIVRVRFYLKIMEQRIKILNDIFSNLQQITQWLPNNIDIASKYMYKAESLIERLEVDDCGSIGGFDQKSPVIKKSGFLLYDRFIALVKRYDNKSEIKKCCQFDLENLGEYFKKLSELRSSF